MDYQKYKEYISHTLTTYTIKQLNHLQRRFVDELIISDILLGQRTLDGRITIDVSKADNIRELVDECIQQDDKAVKIIQHWEFIKDYKYSIFFTLDNSDIFNKVIQKAMSISLKIHGLESNYISSTLGTPLLYNTDEKTILKFNLDKSAYNFAGELRYLKYCVVLVFHKIEEIVELRFDNMPTIFTRQDGETLNFIRLIESVRNRFYDLFNQYLVPMDLDFMVEQAKKQDVKLHGTGMTTASGGNVQLEVGKNEDETLPILGELKEIINEYKNGLLEKAPEVLDALNNFINTQEDMSKYKWILVVWERKPKKNNIKVRFTYNYGKQDYCLLQHYYSNNLVGMERMDYVVQYIDEQRKSDSSKNESA